MTRNIIGPLDAYAHPEGMDGVWCTKDGVGVETRMK